MRTNTEPVNRMFVYIHDGWIDIVMESKAAAVVVVSPVCVCVCVCVAFVCEV